MAPNYGIVTNVSSSAAPPIQVTSKTCIGIAGTLAGLADGLTYIPSAADFLDQNKDTFGSMVGSARLAIYLIATAGLNCPVILSTPVGNSTLAHLVTTTLSPAAEFSAGTTLHGFDIIQLPVGATMPVTVAAGSTVYTSGAMVDGVLSGDFVFEQATGLIFRPTDSTIPENTILAITYQIAGPITVSDAAMVTAITALKSSYSTLGIKPNVIIAPGYTGLAPVAPAVMDAETSALITVVDALLADGFVDAYATDEASATSYMTNFATSRTEICWPNAIVFDPFANANVSCPLSTIAAITRALEDASSEYGFANSISNRVSSLILGSQYPVEFILGEDCAADRLRTAHLTTLIRYTGFRLWGYSTNATDPIWQDRCRQRVFDTLSEAFLTSLFYAVDQRADILLSVKNAVVLALMNMQGAGVLLGYSVTWDSAKNTLATVTAGKFYLNVQMGNTPNVNILEIDLSYTDQFNTNLFKLIS